MTVEIRTIPLPKTEPHEAVARILGSLTSHAEAAGQNFRYEEAVLEAWDGETYLGGLHARFMVDWVFVSLLATTEDARGQKVGSQLIEEIERLAREGGKIGVWLDTLSFQAPGFYAKQGYTEFGRIPDYPKGETHHFFAKRLDGRPLEDGLSG
ncbi:GNAT family N-acetyltransferase [Pseudoroseicyclus aestuarii]|uniref:Acetyltransferase (GNAT) family protein n=1 Tax=Pseudoroseicyclus aestuarii TaxID=1795041 RepID=A0A318SZT0_9RHOB|nr:GNAT family N-acetyltransferase [Pseudoroseicyclus aestuarii]PYE85936.1 acetyltransferase (GNAT) family protein [Pseudoroseicyclus aestuarii]